MWRRHLRAPKLARSSPAAFQEWVGTELKIPVATLRQMELSHYAIIETLHIGGQGLSSDKQSTLVELFGVQRGEHTLLNSYSRSLQLFRQCKLAKRLL